MSDIIEVFKARRSVRAYADTPIPEETLKQIVNESYYSPNAGNKQQLRMVVCRDREINSYLGRLKSVVTTRFWWPEKGDYLAVTDKDLDNEGVFDTFYAAPVVVYLFVPKEFEFGEADAYIMSNNICLIARNYDVGSAIISVATDYFLTDRAKEIKAAWQIPEDYMARAQAILGYPKNGFPDPAPHDKYLPPLFVD